MTDENYKRGYTAGRKKTETEVALWRAALDTEYLRNADFRRAVFLAALPEIIRAPWSQSGKRLNTTAGVVDTALEIADEAMRRLSK